MGFMCASFAPTPSLLATYTNYLSWEFICNLSFEWSLIRRRRQWRWTAAVGIYCSNITRRPTNPRIALHCLPGGYHGSGGVGPRWA